MNKEVPQEAYLDTQSREPRLFYGGRELTPGHVDAIGRLIYLNVFASPYSIAALMEVDEGASLRARRHANRLSGSTLVRRFADAFRCDHDLLATWLHRAATDLATACIPRLRDESARMALKGLKDFAKLDQEMVDLARRIARHGLNASVEDHARFVRSVLLVGIDALPGHIPWELVFAAVNRANTGT